MPPTSMLSRNFPLQPARSGQGGNPSLTDMWPLAIQRICSWPPLAATCCSACFCAFDFTTSPMSGAKIHGSHQARTKPPAFSSIYRRARYYFHTSARRRNSGRKTSSKILEGKTRPLGKPRVTSGLERGPPSVGYPRIQSSWQIHPDNQTNLSAKNSRDASVRLWRDGNCG